jgi:hypothetical protein
VRGSYPSGCVRHPHPAAAAVSRSCACVCIGSPCLRQCVHGASIGGGGGGQPTAAQASGRSSASASAAGGGGAGRGRGGAQTVKAAASGSGELLYLGKPRRGQQPSQAAAQYHTAAAAAAKADSGDDGGGGSGGGGGGGESFLRVHWVAVPQAMRARRVNRRRRRRRQTEALHGAERQDGAAAAGAGVDRAQRRRGHQGPLVREGGEPSHATYDAPCSPCTSHGASVTAAVTLGSQAAAIGELRQPLASGKEAQKIQGIGKKIGAKVSAHPFHDTN